MRDLESTARNRKIAELTLQLKELLPQVLNDTGIGSDLSLHAKYGAKNAEYIDIKNAVINSPEHFASLYFQGFQKCAQSNLGGAHATNYALFEKHKSLRNYLYIFLKRTYLRNYESLSKHRPKIEESELWIGQNNANYGLLITPRFNVKTQQWENDKSEIRHFKPKYWTIGHVLETGFCIPNKNKKMQFKECEDYLNFFLNVLVRNSGSKYEYSLAQLYCEFVQASASPLDIPLLIPELRYNGILNAHEYRLDFCVIQHDSFNKIGIELSPWSSHGYLAKIKGLSQGEINQMASDNFEKEMRKHKDFFRKYGIFALIYTDADLLNINNIFAELSEFLKEQDRGSQLQFHILEEFN